LLFSELAVAGGFLQLGARCLNEEEDSLVKSDLTCQWMALDDHSRAAVPLPLMIEGELDFGSDPERPFREETDPLGRPSHLIFNQVD